MRYDFDKYIERRGTDSVKHDLNGAIFGTDELLPLWVADMDFEVPDFIREAVIERANHPVYGYTFRPGRFFEAAASWMHRRHGWEISPDTFSFSPGIVPALNMIVMEFTEPGDRIVVQPPVYFPFFNAITNHRRELVNNQLVERDGTYEMDLDHLEQQFREGAKMLFLCHPHNPVGRAWTREELEKLARLCVRYKVLVISDEIHSDLVLFGNKHIPLATLGKEVADLTFTCVAPSKTFNLAGLYTSAVITTNPKLKKGYDRILDAVHVGGGSLFGQVAFEAAYTHGDAWLDQLVAYLEQNYKKLCEIVVAEVPGMMISPLEATYLVWLDLSFLGRSDQELKRFVIEEAGLGLIDGPMFGPGGEQHQRINIATSFKVLEKGLYQLAAAAAGYR
ncbi:MAG: PatB family C-S lyase [Bacteroidales bacterium]|nr:PatB family C-S lyase [Bacteroidales bacterium]